MAKRASILDQKETLFTERAEETSHPVEGFVGLAPGQAVLLPVDRIQPDPNQPRKIFSDESIGNLAVSIQEKGLIQPVSVRKADDGFILVAGERRWRAHQKAGLPKIRAFIVNIDDPNEAFEISLVENIQREDLEPLEEAAGIAELIKRKGYKQNEAGKVIGRSKPQVSQLLKLNKLPPEVKEKVSTSKLSRDQLFQIAGQKSPEAMLKLHDRIVRMGLNVRQTRTAAKGEDAPKQHPLVGRLSQLEKVLARVHQDGALAQLKARDKKAAGELLESLSSLIGELRQRL